MSTTPDRERELARLVAQEKRLVQLLGEIYDAIRRPQRHRVLRDRVAAAAARAEDREAYAATMIEFSAWCEANDVSFALTLMRYARLAMDQIDAEPMGELSSAVDGVAGVIRERLDTAGRGVA